MEIKRSGSQPSGKGPAEYFTGNVRVDPLFQANDSTRASGASVTFEPGARSAWHSHRLGQTLIVTAGCGRVQSWGDPIEEIRPGDVVWCPLGEKHWHGAAPTLTGLMFVVTTLIAGIDAHQSILNAAVSAYNTPTVVHFGAVLLPAGILSAPWQSFSSLGLLLGLLGLGMVIYSIIVMRRVPHYQSTLEDWSWYLALPLLANVSLIVAAFMLQENPVPALYIVGAAMLLLLLVGIRNAWDMVTFFAVERAHSENKSTDKDT